MSLWYALYTGQNALASLSVRSTTEATTAFLSVRARSRRASRLSTGLSLAPAIPAARQARTLPITMPRIDLDLMWGPPPVARFGRRDASTDRRLMLLPPRGWIEQVAQPVARSVAASR